MVQAASLLYMDPTAGVGFSYSSNPDDYAYNDTQAQADMQSTLRLWFQAYPYFANHSVFLDGEVAELCMDGELIALADKLPKVMDIWRAEALRDCLLIVAIYAHGHMVRNGEGHQQLVHSLPKTAEAWSPAC